VRCKAWAAGVGSTGAGKLSRPVCFYRPYRTDITSKHLPVTRSLRTLRLDRLIPRLRSNLPFFAAALMRPTEGPSWPATNAALPPIGCLSRSRRGRYLERTTRFRPRMKDTQTSTASGENKAVNQHLYRRCAVFCGTRKMWRRSGGWRPDRRCERWQPRQRYRPSPSAMCLTRVPLASSSLNAQKKTPPSPPGTRLWT
jgi:hypothetical protein